MKGVAMLSRYQRKAQPSEEGTFVNIERSGYRVLGDEHTNPERSFPKLDISDEHAERIMQQLCAPHSALYERAKQLRADPAFRDNVLERVQAAMTPPIEPSSGQN